MTQEVKPMGKATAGFIISLIAGIIDAVVAMMLIAAGSLMAGFEEYMGGFGAGFFSTVVAVWGGIGLVMGIIVIVGAILIYMPGKETIGGILVIVFSIISLFFTAGGLIIGLILGIIGGALGLAKK
ncbi:MAG: hypothetical protein OEY22_08500 [Candidatus Bathyarchaeota archaeon]|nr:hypothetical protein [Candidatus Bathyarchaeota archaeon]MDH5788634.1 hypothetical protein [Candidatus Bathyarchaeota archaeon]